MLVCELAMFLGRRCMVLGLVVLAARVVMLGLMVVMRRRMVVARCGVMMLLRRVFCHLSLFPLLRNWVGPRVDRPTTPADRDLDSIAQLALLGNVRGIPRPRRRSSGAQVDPPKAHTSVSGANAAPALFYALTTNVAVL